MNEANCEDETAVAVVVVDIPGSSPHNNYHPWRRFFSRSVDSVLWGVVFYWLPWMIIATVASIFGFTIVGISSLSGMAATIYKIFGGLSFWISRVSVEAFLMSTVGTTPGKYLFGITVLGSDGEKLSLNKAVKRSLGVSVYGDGLALPVIGMVMQSLSYTKLKKTGQTKWDNAVNSTVRHKKWGAPRAILCTLVVIVPLVGFSVILTAIDYWASPVSRNPAHQETAINNAPMNNAQKPRNVLDHVLAGGRLSDFAPQPEPETLKRTAPAPQNNQHLTEEQVYSAEKNIYTHQDSYGAQQEKTPVEQYAKPITPVVPTLAPKTITTNTIDTVRQAHPDFDSIVQDGSLMKWMKGQRTDYREYCADIIRGDDAEEIIFMVNAFKKVRADIAFANEVKKTHFDYDYILSTQQFWAWLDRQTPEIRAYEKSGNPSEIAILITYYKAAKGNFGRPEQKEKNLYEEIREKHK